MTLGRRFKTQTPGRHRLLAMNYYHTLNKNEFNHFLHLHSFSNMSYTLVVKIMALQMVM